jgi:hypothetical protein
MCKYKPINKETKNNYNIVYFIKHNKLFIKRKDMDVIRHETLFRLIDWLVFNANFRAIFQLYRGARDYSALYGCKWT